MRGMLKDAQDALDVSFINAQFCVSF
jgi:hypothetical protein